MAADGNCSHFVPERNIFERKLRGGHWAVVRKRYRTCPILVSGVGRTNKDASARNFPPVGVA